MSKLGIMFVDDRIKNSKEIENEIWEKEEELIEEAQNKLELWLSEKGLETVMGVVREKQPNHMAFIKHGEKTEISQNLMDAIAVYMDDDIREKLHAELAPCSPEKFLTEYLRRVPSFEKVLEDGFSIEVEKQF